MLPLVPALLGHLGPDHWDSSPIVVVLRDACKGDLASRPLARVSPAIIDAAADAAREAVVGNVPF
eukprot:16109357-Heterocapsa_arctica.AAC.1